MTECHVTKNSDHMIHTCTYLKLNSVELIEAGPGSGAGETLEELAHGQIVQSIGAVEHHALRGQGLGQIFDSLSLSCSSRALWSSPQVEMEGPH